MASIRFPVPVKALLLSTIVAGTFLIPDAASAHSRHAGSSRGHKARHTLHGHDHGPAQVASSKVQALLAQMTPDDKLALIRGIEEPAATNQGQAGYLAGVPRLGIPPLRLADGPPGVLTRHPSPAQTATMGLAATFSREDARRNGEIIADEAHHLGIDVVLEPFINIDRDITFRRGYNTYGEDPVLTGAIAASLITGIQSLGVMAQAKHFVGFDTNGHDVTIDPQTLHEVYLAPFDDAIHAGVSSIMCSYNLINGHYACGNDETQNHVLRGEMKFKGFITSDWGAVHGYDYLPGGLDMEMPGLLPPASPFAGMMRCYFCDTPPPHTVNSLDVSVLHTIFEGSIPEEPKRPPVNWEAEFPLDTQPKNMWDALHTGVATSVQITDAAHRVLTQMERFGYLDGRHAETVKTSSGLDIPTVIRQTSEDAAVLLKNEDNILPLAFSPGTTIAMIGPGAAQVVAIGKAGERSVGLPERQVGPYHALQSTYSARGSDASLITLAVENDMTGQPVPAAVLSHDGQPGLAETLNGRGQGVAPELNYTIGKGNALPPATTNQWTGQLDVATEGDYRLYVQTMGARGELFVDGERIAGSSSATGARHGDTIQANQDNVLPTTDGLNNVRAQVHLGVGKHDIRIETTGDTSNAPEQVRFNWVTPDQATANHAAAIEAARKAKVAVLFLWTRGSPAFGLPGDQNQLVEEIAAVNPNLIVVLNTSQPIAMPWIDKVKAVVQMWWPGDEGGWATANVLTGVKNPGGRLPFTWGKRLEDYAATDPDHPERSGAGVGHKTVYSEGINVGYRWFDLQGTAPLYPFGYGLSYTHFDYSDLKITRARDGGLNVAFTLTNTGSRDGDEVPQVYVSAPAHPPQGVAFAVNALAGFDRVSLKAGASRRVTLQVDRRRLQYWSVVRKDWVDAAATRIVSVGASSGDMRLKEKLP